MQRPGQLAANRRRGESTPTPPGAHRYWRLFFNGVTSGENVAFAETEFLKARYYEIATGTYAASGEPNPSQSLADGTDGTYTRSTSSGFWRSNTAPADIWISLDAGMGNDYALEGFTLAGGNLGGANWTSIDVQWSDDNSTWTTEWTETDFAAYDAANTGSGGSYPNTAIPITWTNPNVTLFTPSPGFNKDGIIIWFKSGDGAFSDNLTTPAADGDRVQTMTNHAGGSELIQQNTFANRPILRAGGLAGMPYLECDPASAQFFEDFAVSLASGSTNIPRYRFGALVDVSNIQAGDELPILGNTASRKNEVHLLKVPGLPVKVNGLSYSGLDPNMLNYGPVHIGLGGGSWANWSLFHSSDYGDTHNFAGGGATIPSTAVTSSQLLRSTALSDKPNGVYFRGKVYEVIYAVDDSKTNEFGQVQAYHIAQYLLGRKLLGAGPAALPESYFLVNDDGDRLNVGDGGKLLVI